MSILVRYESYASRQPSCFCMLLPGLPCRETLPYQTAVSQSFSVLTIHTKIAKLYEALWSASLIFWQFIVHFVIHFRYVSICFNMFNSLWVFDDLCMSSSAMSDVRFSGVGTAQPISVHRWSSLLWRLFACFLSKCMKYATRTRVEDVRYAC